MDKKGILKTLLIIIGVGIGAFLIYYIFLKDDTSVKLGAPTPIYRYEEFMNVFRLFKKYKYTFNSIDFDSKESLMKIFTMLDNVDETVENYKPEIEKICKSYKIELTDVRCLNKFFSILLYSIGESAFIFNPDIRELNQIQTNPFCKKLYFLMLIGSDQWHCSTTLFNLEYEEELKLDNYLRSCESILVIPEVIFLHLEKGQKYEFDSEFNQSKSINIVRDDGTKIEYKMTGALISDGKKTHVLLNEGNEWNVYDGCKKVDYEKKKAKLLRFERV